MSGDVNGRLCHPFVVTHRFRQPFANQADAACVHAARRSRSGNVSRIEKPRSGGPGAASSQSHGRGSCRTELDFGEIRLSLFREGGECLASFRALKPTFEERALLGYFFRPFFAALASEVSYGEARPSDAASKSELHSRPSCALPRGERPHWQLRIEPRSRIHRLSQCEHGVRPHVADPRGSNQLDAASGTNARFTKGVIRRAFSAK
jgi:hypothetical protein